jgi:hypothetical protein
VITLEEKVRAAAEATALEITPDSIPDWPDFAIRAGSGRERRALTARWHMRVLAPLAAAAAVAAVVALAVGISGQTQARRAPGAPAAAAGSLSCTRPDSQCIPRYYLDIKGIIRDRITGASDATVRLPRPYRTIDAIAGAADDRTFVLAAQTEKGYPGPYPVRLFLARFNAADRRIMLSALPIPDIGPGPELNGLAVSPDGSELATAVSAGSNRTESVLSVYSLTGRLSGRPDKVWESPGAIGDSPYDPSGISWSSTGTLAINWVTGKAPTSGIRLLDTASPGGSLLAHSRFVVDSQSTMGGAFSFACDGVLTPDGTTIVAALSRQISLPSSTSKPVFQEEIEEYSAATGRPIRTVDRRTGHVPYVSETLEWTNSSGSVLVVALSPGRGKAPVFGLLSGSLFRSIPDAPTPDELSLALAF